VEHADRSLIKVGQEKKQVEERNKIRMDMVVEHAKEMNMIKVGQEQVEERRLIKVDTVEHAKKTSMIKVGQEKKQVEERSKIRVAMVEHATERNMIKVGQEKEQEHVEESNRIKMDMVEHTKEINMIKLGQEQVEVEEVQPIATLLVPDDLFLQELPQTSSPSTVSLQVWNVS
jgi:hypothetical protein